MCVCVGVRLSSLRAGIDEINALGWSTDSCVVPWPWLSLSLSLSSPPPPPRRRSCDSPKNTPTPLRRLLLSFARSCEIVVVLLNKSKSQCSVVVSIYFCIYSQLKGLPARGLSPPPSLSVSSRRPSACARRRSCSRGTFSWRGIWERSTAVARSTGECLSTSSSLTQAFRVRKPLRALCVPCVFFDLGTYCSTNFRAIVCVCVCGLFCRNSGREWLSTPGNHKLFAPRSFPRCTLLWEPSFSINRLCRSVGLSTCCLSVRCMVHGAAYLEGSRSHLLFPMY